MQSTQNTIVMTRLCRPEPYNAYIVSNAAGESPQLERHLKNVAATGFKMP